MKIVEIIATNLTIPYEVPYRPAWQPGIVRNSRDFTLVRIRSDEGLTGYAGCDGHQAGNIRANVAPYMLGKSVWLTEEFARVFRNAGGTWFIDQALWDLIGKRAGMPLYQVWGAVRDKVMTYASTSELGTPTDRATLAARYRAEGFRAMKLRFHCDSIQEDLALLDAAMEAAPDASFMIDANQATFLPAARRSPFWDFKRALATARALEERGVLWLEEPLAKFDFDNLVRLRTQTDIYIAGGESNRELHEFRWLIERGVYDIVQPDCCLSEGISQLRKIAALAEAHNVHFIPHHGLSALGLAATLHLACCTPGLAWLELMYEPPTRTIETYQRLGGIVTSTIWIDDDGFVRAPSDPGLGVKIDEDVIEKYAV